MIQLERVSLTRGSFSLREIDLTIKQGEHFFIIGPSGSGKTLLLETIAGIHPDAEGRILINGKDMENVPPEKRGLSLMYQDYSLPPPHCCRKYYIWPEDPGHSATRNLQGNRKPRF